jgi:type VI secretion system secreted protein VgrG
MATFDDLGLAFVSGGVPGDSLRLLGIQGRESLSTLFEFELYLSRDDLPLTDDDLAALLHAPCAVALGPGAGDIVHGILRRVRVIDAGPEAHRYVATLVPTASLLTLARTNRVFQDMTVPAMVQAILTQYGLTLGEDFDILTTAAFQPREYAVQYEETDWDFIQRWLESEGLFYWFEHSGVRSKLLISDSNSYATPIADSTAIPYRRRADLASGISSIWSFTREARRLPARVGVFDYNHRTPHIRLVARAPVDAARGFGSVMFYNEHFKTLVEGEAVARIRAERLQCEGRLISGLTDCQRLRAGHFFELTDHYDPAQEGSYLVTSVELRAGHPIPAESGLPDPNPNPNTKSSDEDFHAFTARFEAIPIGVQYRPARLTPWPSIHGVMHAHIDEDGSGEHAQLDDAGRYKVRLPFDAGTATGTAASRWIRMAQAASGVGYGAHQPLHKGAEVLLAHIDGDPDRPIIVGAVPNAHTVSPVTSANATQSVINTHSGIRIEMEDRQPAQ